MSSPNRARCLLLPLALAACSAPVGGAHEALTGAEPRLEGLTPVVPLLEGESAAVEEGLLPEGEMIPPRYLDAEPNVLLDRRDDGATLLGRPDAALADSDPERVMVLVAERAGRTIDPSLEGLRVLDARFAGTTIVTLGADHVLRAHVHGSVRVLDETAEAPLSVEGSVVAYGRGEMPSFELARLDVSTGVVRTLTTDMAPVWSPALSPDGTEIVFVSGVTGVPRLYRMREWGAPELLPDVGAFPSSLVAPRWTTNGELQFEGELGEPHVLRLATGALAR